MIYTGRYYWDPYVASSEFRHLPLWHAQYTSASCPNINDRWSDWAFWQYTSSGSIAGIDKAYLRRWLRWMETVGLAGIGPVPALAAVNAQTPTAELRHGQKDQDSLPPYAALDRFLDAYVEKDLSIEDAVRAGVPRAVARKASRLVDGNEYKRRQAPPGVKITPKAFGRDRRMPITNRYRS